MNEKVKKYSNSVSKRYWWSIKILNRSSLQAYGSTCNKSKFGWDMEFFFFYCNFQPH